MTYYEEAMEMKDEMIRQRRDFHAHPETAWTEFRTTSLIAEELQKLGYEVLMGSDILDEGARMMVPDEKTLKQCAQRAIKEGANPVLVDRMKGGMTGCVGIMHFAKPGKTVALRFDIDSLFVAEDPAPSHRPSALGFQSKHPGLMHACGHDGHATIGLAVARLAAAHKDRMAGTLKICFQPGEEGVVGAKSMVRSGIVDDVDYFISGHIGLGNYHDSSLVCMTQGFLATDKMDAVFTGAPSHAGAEPEKGKNALLAAAQAAISLHTISRHSGGSSRINVGVLEAGTGRNVIPANGLIKFETRGETAEINDFMVREAKRMVRAAAMLYDVGVEILPRGSATSSNSSPEMGEEIYQLIETLHVYSHVAREQKVSGSEDCCYFMSRVQEHGGQAVYMLYGTEEAAGHHQSDFDFNEDVLPRTAGTIAFLVEHFGNQ